jgi:hypothetical protein
MLGRTQQFLRSAALDHFAAVEHRNASTEARDDAEIVTDKQNG